MDTLRLVAFAAVLFAPIGVASSITHQGNTTSEDALSKWLELKAPTNVSGLSIRGTWAVAGMSSWDGVANGLFKRQREENGDGALLCADGKCVDGR